MPEIRFSAALLAGVLCACAARPVETTRTAITPDTLPSRIELGHALEVRRLTDDVWLHVSHKDLPGVGLFPSSGLVVRAPGGILLVDTAWTPEQTRVLLDWVRTALGAEVREVIVTHAHDDRMGGSEVVTAAGATIRALPLTIERASQSGS
ncbi:MAG: MBL fold metallo-hydrolase, partial [Myxococcaceae bacterium]|nr:MBL fold metallo-hydrolase [Myxococcaceae bacterium]